MELLFEMGQNSQIAEAKSVASEARSLAKMFEQRIRELERRADRNALACQAMWELLRAKTVMSDAEVFTKMEEIDLRDGKADGRIGGQVLCCGRCSRNINSFRPVCVYCGYKNKVGTIAH